MGCPHNSARNHRFRLGQGARARARALPAHPVHTHSQPQVAIQRHSGGARARHAAYMCRCAVQRHRIHMDRTHVPHTACPLCRPSGQPGTCSAICDLAAPRCISASPCHETIYFNGITCAQGTSTRLRGRQLAHAGGGDAPGGAVACAKALQLHSCAVELRECYRITALATTHRLAEMPAGRERGAEYSQGEHPAQHHC